MYYDFGYVITKRSSYFNKAAKVMDFHREEAKGSPPNPSQPGFVDSPNGWLQLSPSVISWSIENRPNLVRFGVPDTPDSKHWTIPRPKLTCAKRKLETCSEPQPLKMHISEDKMADQLRNMHISNSFIDVENVGDDMDEPKSVLPSLSLSKEVQNLKTFVPDIIPEAFLQKMDDPGQTAPTVPVDPPDEGLIRMEEEDDESEIEVGGNPSFNNGGDDDSDDEPEENIFIYEDDPPIDSDSEEDDENFINGILFPTREWVLEEFDFNIPDPDTEAQGSVSPTPPSGDVAPAAKHPNYYLLYLDSSSLSVSSSSESEDSD